jgi:hypothetical protein
VRAGGCARAPRAPATGRQETARRLEAARVLAGGPSLRPLAQQCGMRYSHLVAVHTARDPMTFTDARAAALDVPVQWLRYGWVRNVPGGREAV